MTLSKTMVVAGDLVLDHDLARLAGRGRNYSVPCPSTLVAHRHGGAWYVEEMLKVAFAQSRDSKGEDVPTILAPQRIALGEGGTHDTRHVAQAFSVWEMVMEGGDKTWRVADFLGCQCACQGEGCRPPAIPRDVANPDVLVIDDLGLGFAARPDHWPAALGDGAPGSIVAKATTSFDNPLWKKLLAPGLAEKTTVVATALTIRGLGAKLSRASSWDQTIEELIHEFSEGRAGSVFQAVRRVVVAFGAEGVGVFSRLPRSPQEPPLADRLHFERFIYDPDGLEGAIRSKLKNHTFGGHSLLTAAVARHELQGDGFPLFFALCRALEGMQLIHRIGGGSNPRELNVRAAEKALRDAFQFPKDPGTTAAAENKPSVLPEDRFRVAFPRELLDPPSLPTPQVTNHCLLTDVTGDSEEFIATKAEEIVHFGWKKAIAAVPRARYGKYVAVDREEIERVNAIRNLILEYTQNKDARPLSIAVFGQPGSGKSFAIKQVGEEIFGKAHRPLEFNLTQFDSVRDLHHALHTIHDRALEGEVPLVFWDEFDTKRQGEPLGWLKEFLAPMQDARFVSEGEPHPVGRAVFVFAGGTRTSFHDFAADQDSGAKKEAKVPDFISRLRGYVNIKGPNPVDKDDHAYLIRRALLLRSFLERYSKDSVIDPFTGVAGISPGVLAGLLRVKEYKHGARSLEAVVSLSHLGRSRWFGLAELPPREVLEIHVSADFSAKAQAAELVAGPLHGFVELLAEDKHEKWRAERIADGWTWAPERNDAAKQHPLLKPYHELDEAGKDRNRASARVALARLAALGYRVLPASTCPQAPIAAFTPDEKRQLAVSEHQRWMRERFIEGYVYGPHSDDHRRIHRDMQLFNALPDKERRIDDALIEAIPHTLRKMGLALVKER